MACAAGIESARYDFERFLPLQNIKEAGCRKAAFGYFLSRKESNTMKLRHHLLVKVRISETTSP